MHDAGQATPARNTPTAISASILALSAEVARRKEAADKRKAASTGGPVFIPSTKTFKKPKPVQNKGVEARAAIDHAIYEKEHIYDRPDVADERVYLELKRKAELYELRKTLNADSDSLDAPAKDDNDNELVDFVQKRHDEQESGHRADHGPVIKSLQESDWVEFIDEFNRKRLVRKSQLPAMGLKFVTGTGVVDSSHSGPDLVSRHMSHEQERQQWEAEAVAASQSEYVATNTLPHFDYKRENRQMGVGFYAFSQDEAERRKQREELLQIRANTLMAQKVAVAIKAAKQKRIEDRRKMIAERAIRRKRLREHGVLPSSYNSSSMQVQDDEGDALDLVRLMRFKYEQT
ncbi:hypothetical protein SeLEV6574_g02435 [Synchytrium endobioticum]|nr:hypothetical protein SeLEV6574_g02435 [Synchytrium endobioticum]